MWLMRNNVRSPRERSPRTRSRAASIADVTGFTLARCCIQPGSRLTGAKADEMKISGKIGMASTPDLVLSIQYVVFCSAMGGKKTPPSLVQQQRAEVMNGLFAVVPLLQRYMAEGLRRRRLTQPRGQRPGGPHPSAE